MLCYTLLCFVVLCCDSSVLCFVLLRCALSCCVLLSTMLFSSLRLKTANVWLTFSSLAQILSEVCVQKLCQNISEFNHLFLTFEENVCSAS